MGSRRVLSSTEENSDLLNILYKPSYRDVTVGVSLRPSASLCDVTRGMRVVVVVVVVETVVVVAVVVVAALHSPICINSAPLTVPQTRGL